jgi:hypothetical protein
MVRLSLPPAEAAGEVVAAQAVEGPVPVELEVQVALEALADLEVPGVPVCQEAEQAAAVQTWEALSVPEVHLVPGVNPGPLTRIPIPVHQATEAAILGPSEVNLPHQMEAVVRGHLEPNLGFRTRAVILDLSAMDLLPRTADLSETAPLPQIPAAIWDLSTGALNRVHQLDNLIHLYWIDWTGRFF